MKPITELTEDEARLLSAYRALSTDMQVKFLKYIQLLAHGDLVTKAAIDKKNNGRLAHVQFWKVIENQYRLFEQGKTRDDSK